MIKRLITWEFNYNIVSLMCQSILNFLMFQHFISFTEYYYLFIDKITYLVLTLSILNASIGGAFSAMKLVKQDFPI